MPVKNCCTLAVILNASEESMLFGIYKKCNHPVSRLHREPPLQRRGIFGYHSSLSRRNRGESRNPGAFFPLYQERMGRIQVCSSPSIKRGGEESRSVLPPLSRGGGRIQVCSSPSIKRGLGGVSFKIQNFRSFLQKAVFVNFWFNFAGEEL